MENITEDIRIIKYDIKYVRSYNEMMNEVSKEGKYLSTNSGFELKSSESFVKNCIENNFPAYMVINSKDEVIGWCDIVLRNEFVDKLTGSLGVGLRKDYRENGIGRILITQVLAGAADYGFERIILDVRKTNERAIHIYELLGFEFDETKDSTMKIDGESVEIKRMVLELSQETDDIEEKDNKIGCGVWAGLIAGGCAIGLIIAILCIVL